MTRLQGKEENASSLKWKEAGRMWLKPTFGRLSYGFPEHSIQFTI